MDFFRQKKETKKKLSFFLSLAMIVTLLPVSSIPAKAAEESNVYLNQSGLSNAKAVLADASAASGGAITVTVTPDSGYEFTAASEVTITASDSNVDESSVSTEGAIKVTAATGSAVTSAVSDDKKLNDDGTITCTVTGISKATVITVSGTATAVSNEDDATTEPSEEPASYTLALASTDLKNASASLDKESLTADETATLTVTPATGAAFTTAPSASADNATISAAVAGANGTYTFTISAVKANTTVTVTGEAEQQTVTEATDAEKNMGEASLSETDFTDSELQESFTSVFDANSTDTDIKAAAEALAKADSTAYVQVALSVEDAASSVTDAEKTLATAEDTKNEILDAIKASATDIDTTAVTADDIKVGAYLDISLTAICKDVENGAEKTIASTSVTETKKAVTISMKVPDSIEKLTDTTKVRSYYIIRIHEGTKTIISCEYDESANTIKFSSDKFSTYVLCYADVTKSTDTPSAAPTKKPGSSSSYPSGGSSLATPTPTATASPSAEPTATASAKPSEAPTTEPSAAPSTAPSTEPIVTPTTMPTEVPDATPAKKPSTKVKVGTKYTAPSTKAVYKVTATGSTKTVQFTSAKKNAKTVVVPASVKINGVTYKVTSIAKNAFKGNKKLTKVTIGANVKSIGANSFQNCKNLKKIVIKSKKLTKKKTGSNAFKGINSKAVVKVPKGKVKTYKKLIQAKGAGKKVTVKK